MFFGVDDGCHLGCGVCILEHDRVIDGVDKYFAGLPSSAATSCTDSPQFLFKPAFSSEVTLAWASCHKV